MAGRVLSFPKSRTNPVEYRHASPKDSPDNCVSIDTVRSKVEVLTYQFIRKGEMMTTLGATVRRWREERGWEQKELARRSGVSAPYLSRLEADKLSEPSVMKLLQIARAFDRPLSVLLTEAGLELAPRTPDALIEALVGIFRYLSPATKQEALSVMEALQIRDDVRRRRDTGKGSA
jgi:transcriptional regulator with XRE-family HTH domain